MLIYQENWRRFIIIKFNVIDLFAGEEGTWFRYIGHFPHQSITEVMLGPGWGQIGVISKVTAVFTDGAAHLGSAR